MLPAGAYRMRFLVEGFEGANALNCSLRDAGGLLEQSPGAETFEFGRGFTELTYDFAKPYAPFEFSMVLDAAQGEARLVRWSVEPAVGAWIEAVRHVTQERPVWLAASPPMRPVGDVREVLPGWWVDWRNGVRLNSLHLPRSVSPGSTFSFYAQTSLHDYGLSEFNDLVLMIHLTDANRNVVAVMDLPLYRTRVGKEVLPLVSDAQLPAGVAAGQYQVWVGLYNAVSRKRFSLESKSIEGRKTKRRAVHVADLVVE